MTLPQSECHLTSWRACVYCRMQLQGNDKSLVKSGVPRPVTFQAEHRTLVSTRTTAFHKRTTYRIPSSSSGKSIRPTTRIAPCKDIVEDTRARINEGIQEPKCRLPFLNPPIVDKRYHARERGARTACPVEQVERASDVHDEVLCLSRHVGIRPSSGIELACVRVAESGQIRCHRRVLIRRTREDVGEPARGQVGRSLRTDTCRSSDRGDAWKAPLASAKRMSSQKLDDHSQRTPARESGNKCFAVTG